MRPTLPDARNCPAPVTAEDLDAILNAAPNAQRAAWVDDLCQTADVPGIPADELAQVASELLPEGVERTVYALLDALAHPSALALGIQTRDAIFAALRYYHLPNVFAEGR